MALELGHEWIDWERERLRTLAGEARRWIAPLLLGSALAGLFLVALRGNILQMRYQLDASLRAETELAKRKAEVAASYWQLRAPTKLGRHAAGGFEIPSCVYTVRPDGSRPASGCERAAGGGAVAATSGAVAATSEAVAATGGAVGATSGAIGATSGADVAASGPRR